MDWKKFISNYTDAGGRAFDLIEPVDGFHPSQTGNMLLAEMLWEDLALNKPGWLPPINPNNDAIRARFGDQVRILSAGGRLPRVAPLSHATQPPTKRREVTRKKGEIKSVFKPRGGAWRRCWSQNGERATGTW